MDLQALKQQAREGWGKGEYGGLSEILRPAADALADACAVSAGQEILDVAAGDGNFAIACAREGASVVASDLSPEMVEQGQARSDADGYAIEWMEADAEDLPFEDDRFDCVGSVFGAMLTPRPEVAARELFRVVRPGSTVGMTAWVPDGVACELFRIGRRYAPPQDDAIPSHEEWGKQDVVRDRFEGLAKTIDLERRSVPWRADSPEDFVARLERHAPMQAAARENMPADRYARMRAEHVELARGWAGGDVPFSVDAEYLLIVARKRG